MRGDISLQVYGYLVSTSSQEHEHKANKSGEAPKQMLQRLTNRPQFFVCHLYARKEEAFYRSSLALVPLHGHSV